VGLSELNEETALIALVGQCVPKTTRRDFADWHAPVSPSLTPPQR
jgi:hypothetical protein